MDSKNNIQDISLATRLRKQNYERYLDGSNASSIGVGSTVDPTLVLRDLADYNKDSYNKDFDYLNGSYLTRIQENNSYGSIYGFRYKGVYQYNDYQDSLE